MIKLKHVGIRPEGKTIFYDDAVQIEKFPNGGYRLWNNKVLKSGCENEIEVEEISDLIYCKHCGEICNANQFIKLGENDGTGNA